MCRTQTYLSETKGVDVDVVVRPGTVAYKSVLSDCCCTLLVWLSNCTVQHLTYSLLDQSQEHLA